MSVAGALRGLGATRLPLAPVSLPPPRGRCLPTRSAGSLAPHGIAVAPRRGAAAIHPGAGRGRRPLRQALGRWCWAVRREEFIFLANFVMSLGRGGTARGPQPAKGPLGLAPGGHCPRAVTAGSRPPALPRALSPCSLTHTLFYYVTVMSIFIIRRLGWVPDRLGCV